MTPRASRRTGREPLDSSGSHQANVPVVLMLNGLSVARIEVLLFPVASVMRLLDPTPLLQPRYGPSSLLRVGPSQCSAAPFTPVAVRAVIRLLANLSQVNHTRLVLTTFEYLTTRLRRVHFRSSLECTPARVCLALFSQRTPPRLFTAAAWKRFETCS